MTPQTKAAGSAVSGKSPRPLGSESGPTPNWTPGPLGHNDAADLSSVRDDRLAELLKKYRDLIADARRRGKNVAADNLEHWLNGSGDDRQLSESWLRGFSDVTDAETENRKRFEEKTIAPYALQLQDAYSGVKQDYWDNKLTASVFDELYYASGTSSLTSRGKFGFARHGDWVHVVGMVEHHWWDPYDWHANLSAYIPGHGSISDADALELEAAGYGRPFGMYSFWHETLQGKYGIDTGRLWLDEQEYTWSQIEDGRANGRVGHHHLWVDSAGQWPADHDAVTDRDGNPLPGLR